jgi:hypothetical protein
MPGSESFVAFSEMLAEEVTFHEGKGVKGSASVVVEMAAVKTASHRALGDRILSDSCQNKKMKEKKKQQSNKSSYEHARYHPIRLVPSHLASHRRSVTSRRATPHLQKRRRIAGRMFVESGDQHARLLETNLLRMPRRANMEGAVASSHTLLDLRKGQKYSSLM